jgi:hypothetical protein
MRDSIPAAACAAALMLSVTGMAAGPRDAVFLDLVKERHIPPVSKEQWARHIGEDCVWVGRGLRVAGRAEVQGLQLDTGKRVDIQDFTAHDYGDVAVLTYLVIEHQPQVGREVTTRLRKMDTYTRMWREGARLLAQTEGQEPGELLPLSPTVFFDASQPEEGGPENIFVLDARGQPTEWIYRDGATEIRSRRLP